MDNGWIKIHRSMLLWEWYSDTNVLRLFFHLLLKANWEDKKWQGTMIKRGTLISSYGNLAKETGLTFKQVRTVLDKLKSTQEISVKGANKFSTITICKYDSYQSLDDDKGQTKGKQRANKGQQLKNIKNIIIKEDINGREIKFKNEIFEHTNFSYNLLNDFYNYWSERTPGGKKMRFETQKTFEIKKRLVTWQKNESKFKPRVENKTTFAQRIMKEI